MPAVEEYNVSTAIIANNALLILRGMLHCKVFHSSLTVPNLHGVYLSFDVAKKPASDKGSRNG